MSRSRYEAKMPLTDPLRGTIGQPVYHFEAILAELLAKLEQQISISKWRRIRQAKLISVSYLTL